MSKFTFVILWQIPSFSLIFPLFKFLLAGLWGFWCLLERVINSMDERRERQGSSGRKSWVDGLLLVAGERSHPRQGDTRSGDNSTPVSKTNAWRRCTNPTTEGKKDAQHRQEFKQLILYLKNNKQPHFYIPKVGTR